MAPARVRTPSDSALRQRASRRGLSLRRLHTAGPHQTMHYWLVASNLGTIIGGDAGMCADEVQAWLARPE